MPTEFGSPLWAGRTPRRDAAAVARLRAAGAVIMGKTVTTEYAYFHPGKTRNPHDPGAHARRLVERLGGGGRGQHGAGRDRLADQRLGHPSGGVLRRGRLQADARPDPAHRRADAVAHARSCRRVRAHGRGRGAARRDARRLSTRTIPTRGRSRARRFAAVAASEPPLPPRFAFVRSPAWKHAEPVTREAFAELVEALGEAVSRGRARRELRPRDRPAPYRHGSRDGAQPASRLRAGRRPAQRSRCARCIERGRERTGGRLHARGGRRSSRSTPRSTSCSTSTMPFSRRRRRARRRAGLRATGNPVFCTIWTYLGTPADHAAAAATPRTGLPIGVQLVGRRGNDARLLRTRALACQNTRARRPRPGGRDQEPRGPRQERQGVMIMTLVTGIIGIAMLVAFLGFMVVWVKALPLIIIVVLCDAPADLRFRARGARRVEQQRALTGTRRRARLVPRPLPDLPRSSESERLTPPSAARRGFP